MSAQHLPWSEGMTRVTERHVPWRRVVATTGEGDNKQARLDCGHWLHIPNNNHVKPVMRCKECR